MKLRGALISVVVFTGAIAAGSPALASTSLGEVGHSNVVCDGPASYVQKTTGALPSYAVPAAGGVITSWSTSAGIGGAQVRLALMRPTGMSDRFTTVAASAPETLGAGALNSFATRMPAQAGDLLGLLILSGAHNCVLYSSGDPNDRGVREVGTVFDVGETGIYTEQNSSLGSRLNLTATVEADANGDGIGDEPPQTEITKGAAKTINKPTIKFKFDSPDPGALFECKIDKSAFKPCRSPKKVKRLKRGKHEFQVRALDTDGHRDTTPAKDKFKVVG